MKVFTRLLVATALIIPAGIAVAPAAQASSGNFKCTASAGQIKVTPGLNLTEGRQQRYQGTVPGLTCTGGFVSGGDLTFNLNSANRPERCQTLKTAKRQHNGPGIIKWKASDKAGKSQVKLNLVWTGATGGTISGKVLGTSVASGKAISGTFTTKQSLDSVNGSPKGNCSVKKLINFLDLTAFSIQAPAAAA
jgi:hypothetical protein